MKIGETEQPWVFNTGNPLVIRGLLIHSMSPCKSVVASSIRCRPVIDLGIWIIEVVSALALGKLSPLSKKLLRQRDTTIMPNP